MAKLKRRGKIPLGMIRTGKPPIAYEDILEQIAVVDAGQIAQRTGERVYVEEVMSGKVRL